MPDQPPVCWSPAPGVHRPPSRHVPQAARLLGARRRPQVSGVHAESTPTSSSCAICAAGTSACRRPRGVDHVYALAADMGGMGFISANHATILRNNALINLHTLEAAGSTGCRATCSRSSACIYPAAPPDRRRRHPAQGGGRLPGRPAGRLRVGEAGRRAALPRTTPTSSGWRRGSSRFHNIYGPYGTYDGGREKAPAAICRKVALAEPGGTDRDLGRRRADALLLPRRRLRRGHLPPDAVGLPGAAQPRDRRAGQHQRAAAHHHRALRQAGAQRAATSTGRRASGAATPTTPGCARCSAGSRRSRSKTGLLETYRGSSSKSASR